MDLLLSNLRYWTGECEGSGDLRIRGRRVVELGRGLASSAGERRLDARDYLALPGLINCHDHLDLDLLPRLGNPPYRNFYEWAEDIYRPESSPIREVLDVSLSDRLRWGGWKNLVAGATTVVHHDRYHRRVFWAGFPVRVLRRYGWSHSLGYSRDPAREHRRSRGKPWMIHAAEGVDGIASAELDRLDALGLLDNRSVLVHAIALAPRHVERLAQVGAKVIWCPGSNLHLYGRTAPVGELEGRVAFGLGTDSTLSGSPHLLAELRLAATTGLASPTGLLRAVTTAAASIFALRDGRGGLAAGGPADLLLLPDGPGHPADVLLRATPADVALVMIDGSPRLAAPHLAAELGLGEAIERIEDTSKWLYRPLASLRERIRATVGGHALTANPLWATMASEGAC